MPRKTNFFTQRTNFLYLPEKITDFPLNQKISYNYQKIQFSKQKISYTFNTARLFFILAKLSKQIRVLTNNIQSLFVKYFCFPYFTFFFYNQPVIVFLLPGDFYIVRNQIVTFCFSVFQIDEHNIKARIHWNNFSRNLFKVISFRHYAIQRLGYCLKKKK